MFAGWWIGCLAQLALACSGGGEPVHDNGDGQGVVRFVDPFIGTAGDGNVYPGATAPWGMVSVSPHNRISTPADAVFNRDVAPGGYLWGEPSIMGFGQTHISGAGCPDLGAPTIAPTVGAIRPSVDDYKSAYADERASAGYYAVTLTDYDVRVEATASPRVGVMRLRFPASSEANLLVDAGTNLSWGNPNGFARIVSSSEVEGWSDTGLFCFEANNQRVFFVVRTSRAATSSGVWADGQVTTGAEATGTAGAYLTFDTSADAMVEVYVGVSFVSIENARANLDAELAGREFDALRAQTEASWETLLSRVRVSGGTERQCRVFYTALYRTMLDPSVFSDVNGEYVLPDGGIGNADGYERHHVFGLWDTYRGVHPLLTLLYPERQRDMVRTIAALTTEAMAPPRWEIAGHDMVLMVGDPAAIVLADSYAKGITDFDVEGVFAIMRDAALRTTEPIHRPGNVSYQALGYVPIEEGDDVWGPVSTTLEYALADWAMARLADAVGESKDAVAFDDQAIRYRTLFDASTGTLRPKDASGAFDAPFDPDSLDGSAPQLHGGGRGFVEGTAWNYAFFAPHDVAGLIDLHGGPAEFTAALQWVFDNDRFVMWNEPDISYPYLFNYVPGEAWRTQQQARAALDRFFDDTPEGLPGNDDTGALSAWVVFTMIGVYPDLPGSDRYGLGSPVFDRVEIDLGSTTFIIEAPGTGPYVHDATLNGNALDDVFLTHAQLVAGGTLSLTMRPSR